jgi:hypothetical protein
MSVLDRKVSEVLRRTARAIGMAIRRRTRRGSGCGVDFAEAETDSVCDHDCCIISCGYKKAESSDRLYL